MNFGDRENFHPPARRTAHPQCSKKIMNPKMSKTETCQKLSSQGRQQSSAQIVWREDSRDTLQANGVAGAPDADAEAADAGAASGAIDSTPIGHRRG